MQHRRPDYRAHVRRQFQRVYDSPDSPPQGFRIGPPELHATTVEQFEPSREAPRIHSSAGKPGSRDDGAPAQTRTHGRSLLSMPVSSADRAGSDAGRRAAKPGSPVLADKEQVGNQAEQDRALLRQFNGVRLRQAGNRSGDKGVELFDPTDDDLDTMENEALRRQAASDARRVLTAFDAAGYDTAAGLLRHYLEGSGGPMTIPGEIVQDYGGVRIAEPDVVGFYQEWLAGDLPDTTFGSPTLNMRDGDRIVVGGRPFGPPDPLEQRVLWEKVFKGAGDDGRFGEVLSEAQVSIGGGTLQGFGYLILERQGNRIDVSGFIDFRVTDRYDFALGQVIGLDLLETDGSAKPFRVVTTTWRKPVEATIHLVNGKPQPFSLRLVGE